MEKNEIHKEINHRVELSSNSQSYSYENKKAATTTKSKIPEKEIVDLKEYQIPEIFYKEDIQEIKSSYAAISFIYPKIKEFFISNLGVEFDSNMLIATAEFNFNNLEFLSSKFSFPDDILAKLLNSMMSLLNLREKPDKQFNSTFESKNIYSMHGSQTNILNKREMDIDFCEISKNRLNEFKILLVKQGLIKPESFSNYNFLNFDNLESLDCNLPNPHRQNSSMIETKNASSTSLISLNNSTKKQVNLNAKYRNKIKFSTKKIKPSFYLQNNELAILLDYLNVFYFPFIRLYYHFLNIEQITENKKIEIIIEKPSEVPSLNLAVEQIINNFNIEDEFLANNSTKFRLANSNSSPKIKVLKNNDINNQLNINLIESNVKNYFEDISYNNKSNEGVTDKYNINLEKTIDEYLKDVDKTIGIKENTINDKMNYVESLYAKKK